MNQAEQSAIEQGVRELCDRRDYGAAATLALRKLGAEVYSFLVSVMRDEALADDCFSAFSEGLWRGLPKFEWNSSLRTWLYAIARNTSRTELRGARRRRNRNLQADTSDIEAVAEQVRTETLTFLKSEKKTRLQVLRDSLTEEERMLLVLRVDRNLSWNDLALVLADDPATLEGAALTREAARLRKRFQIAKDRLRAKAKEIGLRE